MQFPKVYLHKKLTKYKLNEIEMNSEPDEKGWFEMRFIWVDEKHPNLIIDPIYRIYRFFKYKRIKDIETLKINFTKKEIKSTSWGFGQKWNKFRPKHFHRTYKFKDFNWNAEKTQFDIFIVTWNHLFDKEVENLEDYRIIKS